MHPGRVRRSRVGGEISPTLTLALTLTLTLALTLTLTLTRTLTLALTLTLTQCILDVFADRAWAVSHTHPDP